MELQFIAISLVILLLTPGSMLSAFEGPAGAQRITQLPAAQAFPTDAARCIRFEQEA
jgi:hypothetical protein